jgi:hypothetical protein
MSTGPEPARIMHPVPYHSQWASPELVPEIIAGTRDAETDPLWSKYGAGTREEYAWWARRLCGMACLRMCLDHWQQTVPTAMDLARECVEAGAYVHRGDGGLDGLIYAPFAAYATRRWRLEATVRPHLPPARNPSTHHRRAAGDALRPSLHPHPGTRTSQQGRTPCPRRRHDPRPPPDPQSLRIPQPVTAVRPRPWPDLDRFYAGRGVVLGPGPVEAPLPAPL